jgi:hypothetical protein
VGPTGKVNSRRINNNHTIHSKNFCKCHNVSTSSTRIIIIIKNESPVLENKNVSTFRDLEGQKIDK